MFSSNKFNKESGIGEKLKLYQEKIYKIKPNDFGQFFDETGRLLAERTTLNLTQNGTYKTQFFNEKLAITIAPISESTKLVFYNEDGEVPNSFVYAPVLNPAFASIICSREPKKPFTAVSAVVYCGPGVNNILLSDGSIQMEKDYRPVKEKDVVTKEYTDSLVENFTALSYPLKTFSIKQSDIAPISAYCYLNNSKYENVLFLRNAKDKSRMQNCTLTVDDFAVPNTFGTDVQIGLVVDGTTSYIDSIENILAGNSSMWRLVDTENVYTAADIPQVYWKNSFELEFNLESFLSKVTDSKPYLNISVRIWDTSGHSKYSNTDIYGIDEYITDAVAKVQIDYIPENFTKFKSKWISGYRYFDPNPETVYNLPITVKVENDFLKYFRSENNLILQVVNSENEILESQKLAIIVHQPLTGTFAIDTKINFTVDFNILRIIAFNVKDEEVFRADTILDTSTDSSDESNRVTSPTGSLTHPDTDYGETWISSQELNPYDMKLRNGEYASTDVNSTVCFCVKGINECYSHINVDIEHDGEMYIKSEGNTGWLSCQKQAEAFSNPLRNGAGCKVNEGYFTFGKVTYTSKVFIRIIKATTVKFHSAILG